MSNSNKRKTLRCKSRMRKKKESKFEHTDKEEERSWPDLGLPSRLVCNSCQIRAGGTIWGQDEMTELFTNYTLVPFGGTAATFSKGISCHSAWTWASSLSCRLLSAPLSWLLASWQYNNIERWQARLPQTASYLMSYLSLEVLLWLQQVVRSKVPLEGGALSHRVSAVFHC